MNEPRQPRGSDLMDARAIADFFGVEQRTAENMRDRIAREHGGPVVVAGVRRIFVRRDWVEASVGQRAS